MNAAKVKLDLDQKQEVFLGKHFDSYRFVYNDFFEKRDIYHIKHKDAEKSSLNYLDIKNILELKKKYPGLYEVNYQAIKMSLRFFDNAFKNFIHKSADLPKFTKNRKNDYFALTQHITINGNRKYFFKSDRTYSKDSFGLRIGKDYNASKNIMKIGLIKINHEQAESMPVEISRSSLYRIYPYKHISVYEGGSSDNSARV